MAERSGSVLTVRSAASPRGRGSAGSIEAKFGSVYKIGFTPTSSSSPEVKQLPGLPLINLIPQTRSSRPSMRILGRLENRIPEFGNDPEQPKVVVKSIFFPEPIIEPVQAAENNTEIGFVAGQQVEGKILFLEPKIAGVNPELDVLDNKVALKMEVKSKPKTPSNPNKYDSANPYRQFIAANRLRGIGLRPLQARVAVVIPDLQIAQSVNRQEMRLRIFSNDKETVSEGAQLVDNRVTRNVRKPTVTGLVERNLNGEFRKRRAVARAEDVNKKREQLLLEISDRLTAADPENVTAKKVVERANLFTDENGSPILTELGYQKIGRRDGGLYRLAEALEAKEVLSREDIARAVRENTAVMFSDSLFNEATHEEVSTVLTPPRSLFAEALPPSFYEEIHIASVKPPPVFLRQTSTVQLDEIIEEPIVNSEVTEEPLEGNLVVFPSRLLDRLMHNVMEIEAQEPIWRKAA